MKRFGLCLVVVLLSQFLIAADWEGTGTLSSSGLLPDEGYYIASNAFPRNTIVDLTNMETRQTVRVIVASGLDSPGMLAMVSRDAANLIGLTGTAIGRIRISLPNDLGLSSAIREDRVSRSGDPDRDPLAAVRSTNREIEDFLAKEPPFVYPTEVDTTKTPENPAPNASSNAVDVPEKFTPSAVTTLDDSVVAEILPQPLWVYPLEVDETFGSADPAEEDLSENMFEIIPTNDAEKPVAEISPEPAVIPPKAIYERPESSAAVVESENTEEDFPETNEPPVLIGEANPSVAVVPSELKSAPKSSPIVPPLEIYETPSSSIVVMEPGMIERDFPETNNPPILVGDENPSVTVIPSEIFPSETETASISLEDNANEEIYETPDSSIAVMEPELAEDDTPEISSPPVSIASENPSAVISPDNSPSQVVSESSEEEKYEAPTVIAPAPPLDDDPRTETELAFVPAEARPPEAGNIALPRDAEIVPLPETSPAANVSSAGSEGRRFSVESISSLTPGAYYVQLGAFSERDLVEQVIKDVGSAYPLKVQSAGSSSKPIYKVLLGPVNIGEGSALLRRFKTRGYTDSFIIPNRGY